MSDAARPLGASTDDDRALARSVSEALGQFFRGELKSLSSKDEFREAHQERLATKS